jgi:hypothetical protein
MRRDPIRAGRRGRTAMAALGLGLAFALAACGGSSGGGRVASLGGDDATGTTSGAAASASKDPQQAALDFARCMRGQGIDMPDPQVDDQGRVRVRIGAGGGPGAGGARPDPKKLEAAQKACGGLFGGGDGSRQVDPEARDAMVDFARCMRGQGIDMPDPSGDGLLLRRGDGPDPASAEFQAAEKACNHHLAKLRRPDGESGGQP